MKKIDAMERYSLIKNTHSMIRALLIAVVILAGAAQPLPAWAQSTELMATFKQYQALNKQGKYAEAVPFAQTFIQLVKKEFGETHQHYASGLNNLALLYKARGRYADAKPLYKRSLAIHEKASARTTPLSPTASTTWPGFTGMQVTRHRASTTSAAPSR